MEGWASVQGDGLQMGLEDPLQLPLHNGLEENISSLCHWVGCECLAGTGEGYRSVVKKLGFVRGFGAYVWFPLRLFDRALNPVMEQKTVPPSAGLAS